MDILPSGGKPQKYKLVTSRNRATSSVHELISCTYTQKVVSSLVLEARYTPEILYLQRKVIVQYVARVKCLHVG